MLRFVSREMVGVAALESAQSGGIVALKSVVSP